MPSIELRTRQSLALTPRLQQSVRLLQLSALEFQQELRTALDTNPFLEYDSSETEDVALAGTTPGEDAGALPAAADTLAPAEPDGMPAESAGGDTLEGGGQDDMPADFSGDYGSRSSSRQNGDADGSDPADWARSQPTLREQLHDALRLYRLDDRDRAVARFIIEALDDDGYLRQSLAELADSVDLEPELSEEELLVALRLVQSLDRPGLGARSLSECLALQIHA
ncbi:MAG TPA: RNA polymerase factor sigma-54, partial [Paraburkholderia sp.]|nr:RNA polymerase factor sigma-54 [Paraburkholderia sp.]